MSEAPNQTLCALLSQVFVAFVIEFDNEFESRMPHRTTRHSVSSHAKGSPWLASMAIWFTCLRYVTAEGITVGELEEITGLSTNLDGVRRWGYVSVEASTKSITRRAVLRPTNGGLKAREVWEPLFEAIELRWRDRFGKSEIAGLKRNLLAMLARSEGPLPDYLPILGYGLATKGRWTEPKFQTEKSVEVPLPCLLAKLLLLLANEFEEITDVSLAIHQNLLRVLNDVPIPLKEIPLRTGVSTESVNMGLGFLEKRHLVCLKANPDAPGKTVRLTAQGSPIREQSLLTLEEIETRWRTRHREIGDLLRRLEEMSKTIRQTIVACPEGWRASVPTPTTLPHFPMILHRGGYPDGS